MPIQGPGGLGMHFGDFDGDGRGELLLAGLGYDRVSTGTIQDSYRLAVLAPAGVDAYAMRSVGTHLGRLRGRTIAWTSSDGVMRVAALVSDGMQTSIVIHAGTSPSTIERILHVPLVVALDLVADIDGDGSLEMVVRTSTGSWSDQKVTSLALDSGQVKWVSPYGADDVAAGQLDADPAMELVLAGTPGRILDGASGAVEWSYTSGFGANVVVGRFGDDPTKDAIVAGFFESAILFRAQPYSPVREVPTIRGAFTRAPRADGGDLLARGSFVYDLRTGDVVAGDHADETWSVAVADFDGDGDLEIAFSDGLQHTGGDRLIVRSLPDNATELMMLQESGPHTAIATGDISGTGKQEVVFSSGGVSRSSHHLFAGPRVRVLDEQTGAVLRERGDLFSDSNGIRRIALAQLDADPALEIIVSGDDPHSHSLMALDGATLQTQWIATQRPPGDPAITGMSLVDIDGSGVPALVVLTGEGRLARYDAATGSLVWYTEAFPSVRFGGMGVYVDHAGVPTAIAYGYDELRVFDLRSRESIRSVVLPSSGIIAGVDVFQDAAGSCRAGVPKGATLHILACETLEPIDHWPIPAGAQFLRWVRGGSSMLIGADGVLHLVQGGGFAHALSGFMGAALGEGNQAVLREDARSGEIDLLIGSGHMVKRMRIPQDRIFSGGFDADRPGR